jgi:hypothetical protein
VTTTEICAGRFRANPAYRIVRREQMYAADLRQAGACTDDDAPYGCLRPRRGCGLPWRWLAPDTALLLLTLAEPGPLPAYLLAQPPRELGRRVSRLVLEAVLEIERGGAFRSGAAALAAVGRPERSRNALAALSIEALQYGEALGALPHAHLARRLYDYGRRPVSPRRARQLRDDDAVDAFLGLSAGGPAQTVLERSWIPAGEPDAYWRLWRPRRPRPSHEEVACKLYISPAWSAVPEAFLATAESLADAPGIRGFKIARDVAGLSRPDKLVAYFTRLDDLQAAAMRLRGRLEGAAAHGVAFTAALARDGLLSWGADPPRLSTAGSVSGGSWRLWVATRLAESLLTAGAACEPSPWRYALARLQADGVDTETWVPDPALWRREPRRPAP